LDRTWPPRKKAIDLASAIAKAHRAKVIDPARRAKANALVPAKVIAEVLRVRRRCVMASVVQCAKVIVLAKANAVRKLMASVAVRRDRRDPRCVMASVVQSMVGNMMVRRAMANVVAHQDLR
jgi:hypothetical protein